MPIIFTIIRHFILYNNYLKINSIKESFGSKVLLVTFFSLKHRYSLSIKPIKDIMENDDLINQFDPLDAAQMGNLLAKAQYKKIFEKRQGVSND